MPRNCALDAFWGRVIAGEPVTWLGLCQAYREARKEQIVLRSGRDWPGRYACKSARKMVKSGLASLEGDELGPPLTQLLLAIPDGYSLPLVECLVGMGCDVNGPGRGGWRPLHLCRSGATALFLLRSGADPEGLMGPHDEDADARERPIEVALRFGAAGVFEALVGAGARLLRGSGQCTWTWGEVGACGGLPSGRGDPCPFLRELGRQTNCTRAVEMGDAEGQTALDAVGWPAYSPTLDSLIADHRVEPRQGRMTLFRRALEAKEGKTLKSYVAGYGVGDEEVLHFIRLAAASEEELRKVLEVMFSHPSAAELKASTRDAAMRWVMDNKLKFGASVPDLLGMIGADFSRLLGRNLEDDVLLLPLAQHIRPPMSHYYNVLRTAFQNECFADFRVRQRYNGCTCRLIEVHGFLDGAYEDRLACTLLRLELTSESRKLVDLWVTVGRGNPANLVKVLVGSKQNAHRVDWAALAKVAWKVGWEADLATWPADEGFLALRSYPTPPHPATVPAKAALRSAAKEQPDGKDLKPIAVRPPPAGVLGFPTDLNSVGDLPPLAPRTLIPPTNPLDVPALVGDADEKAKGVFRKCLSLFGE